VPGRERDRRQRLGAPVAPGRREPHEPGLRARSAPGKTLHEWFSLDGNPDPEKTWSSTSLEYVDAEGELQLMTMALTPAHFALGEIRFKKQFSKLNGNEAGLVPIEEFIDLPESQRDGKTPFIYSADSKKCLIRLRVSPSVVALVEERRKYWHLLQYLAGQHVSKMSAEYQAGIAALKAQVQERREAARFVARQLRARHVRAGRVEQGAGRR